MHQHQFWNLLAKQLAGEASDEETQELTSLIKSYPELSYAAQHVSDIWKLPQPLNKEETEKAFQKHLSRLQEYETEQSFNKSLAEKSVQHPYPKRWILPLVIVILCLSLATGFILWNRKQLTIASPLSGQTEEIYTRPGTRTRLVLPDSSVVWLNAGSKLSYSHPFGITDRKVFLSGEAFFNVVKKAKPFIIHTNGVQIKVLGTTFNVRSYPSEKKIETSLVQGEVEVFLEKSPEKKYVLKPNEKLTLNTLEHHIPAGQKQQEAMAILSTLHYLDNSTIAETSWVENKLVFNDEPFDDIAKRMERWYGVTIHFRNEKVKKERLSGVFEKENIIQALTALQETIPFQFSRKDNEITITHKNQQQ